MRVLAYAFVAAAALAAAGCSSGTTTPAAPALVSAGQSTTFPPAHHAAGTRAVTISFAIPGRAVTSASTRVRPRYVSASTQSVTAAVDGGSAAVATSNCANGACTVTVDLTPGKHSVALRLWDAANGGGNELASNTAATCSVTIAAANTCTAILYGLAASVQMATVSTNVVGSQAGSFTYTNRNATPFTVVALDADGNQILGAGSLALALTASSNNITIATPAPNAAPISAPTYSITDTEVTAQTVTASVTPAPNSDGSAVSANVTLAASGPYAGDLFYFTSANNFEAIVAATGLTAVSIPNPVTGAPFSTTTGNTVLLNGSGSGTLNFFDLTTDTITHTVTNSCASADNVPLAADRDLFFYECGGHVYAYNTSGTQTATWTDGETWSGVGQNHSTGFIAAGGGFVYTIVGTTVTVYNAAGTIQRTFTVANFPSPQWAFAASAQGLFIANGTTARLYSYIGALVTSISIVAPSCDFQPVGNYLTVRAYNQSNNQTFESYDVATGLLTGTVTPTDQSQDCRVGYSN
jgi:hypothetical protein